MAVAKLKSVEIADIAFRVVGLTDRGRVRRCNEDAFLIDPKDRLILVADGMGGQGHGDVASRETLQAIHRFYQSFEEKVSSREEHLSDAETTLEENRLSLEHWVREAIGYANDHVYRLNRRAGRRDGQGMGSTIVGLWALSAEWGIHFHVGDSRLYLYRNGVLNRLTRDHSLYQLWLDSGQGGEPPPQNILTRSIGPFPKVTPEVAPLTFMPGDRLLLCTDGLTTMVTDQDLQDLLDAYRHRTIETLCRHLIDEANRNGGRDNITVVIAEVG